MSKRKEANRKVAEAEALAEKARTSWCFLHTKPSTESPKRSLAYLGACFSEFSLVCN